MKKQTYFITLFTVILAGLLLVLTGCDTNKKTDTTSTEPEDTEEVAVQKPESLGMSQDSLDAAVMQKGVEEVEEKKSELVKEAATAIENITDALIALNEGNKKEALGALEKATGKLELLLTRDPEMGLVPLDASITTHDLVADLEAIKRIKKAARKAIKDDHFQVVRDEVASLASEIRVKTVMLPLATFPDAIKAAALLIEEDKLDAAKLALYDAMNTLVVNEQRIPLPILRAEAMIEEAKKNDAGDEDMKKEVLQLLENAEYQLIMAEELGYGKRDKEYAELNKAIEEIRKSVESDGDSQDLFQKLKDKLAKFKDRISK